MQAIFISSLLIIFGIICAILAIKLHRRALYLFFAALCLQTGLFILLIDLKIIGFGFPEAWPLLSIFTGTAFLAAGRHRYRAFKVNYIVLSVTFVILGVIMMIFAPGTGISLAQFVSNWWALLVLLPGLTLILIFLSARYAKKIKNEILNQ